MRNLNKSHCKECSEDLTKYYLYILLSYFALDFTLQSQHSKDLIFFKCYLVIYNVMYLMIVKWY